MSRKLFPGHRGGLDEGVEAAGAARPSGGGHERRDRQRRRRRDEHVHSGKGAEGTVANCILQS